jgi:hypothetical protein
MAKEKDLKQVAEQQMPVENKVESLIRVIRGQQVMLDRDGLCPGWRCFIIAQTCICQLKLRIFITIQARSIFYL